MVLKIFKNGLMSRIINKLKEVSGVKHQLNHDLWGTQRWGTCYPDLTRLIESFYTQTPTDFDVREKPHHEDT